jgi:hypothetical protein
MNTQDVAPVESSIYESIFKHTVNIVLLMATEVTMETAEFLLEFSFDVFTSFIVPRLAFMFDARASFMSQS